MQTVRTNPNSIVTFARLKRIRQRAEAMLSSFHPLFRKKADDIAKVQDEMKAMRRRQILDEMLADFEDGPDLPHPTSPKLGGEALGHPEPIGSAVIATSPSGEDQTIVNESKEEVHA